MWKKGDQNPRRNRHSTAGRHRLLRVAISTGRVQWGQGKPLIGERCQWAGGGTKALSGGGGARLVWGWRRARASQMRYHRRVAGFKRRFWVARRVRATLGRPWNVSSQLFSRGPISLHILLRAEFSVAAVQRAAECLMNADKRWSSFSFPFDCLCHSSVHYFPSPTHWKPRLTQHHLSCPIIKQLIFGCPFFSLAELISRAALAVFYLIRLWCSVVL